MIGIEQKYIGLPEDGTFCFILFGKESDISWSVGGYDVNKKQFFVNLGIGGMIVKADDVIAWKPWNEVTVNHK